MEQGRAAETSEITALITAAEMYPALEELVDAAQDEVFMSFRIFDPETRLRSPALTGRGLQTWGDLMGEVARRGVRVRIVISDFDPIFTEDLHQDAWRHARIFADAMGAESRDAEVMATPHGHAAGWGWRALMRRKITAKIREWKSRDAEELTPLQRKLIKEMPQLRPVTLHQKLAVVDGQRAVLGGLDVDERRWDDPRHRCRAEDTWHDVSLGLEGPICAHVRRHFIDTWNAGLECSAPLAGRPGARLEAEGPLPALEGCGLARTVSTPCTGLATLGPKRHLTEHEDLLIEKFAEARDHIYIETQFFRHWPLADALIKAAQRRPELNLILVMPSEPERVIFAGDRGLDARYAQALQLRNLDLCRRAFGDRMAVVTPAMPRRATPDTPKPVRGAGIVYVHAKVVLIDDTWGMVGSANLNGRSMRWDTEASVWFEDAEAVRHLRERLASIWLSGHRTDGDPRRAATWTAAAQENAGLEPDDREGFVMPWPEQRNRRFARFVPILPADMF